MSICKCCFCKWWLSKHRDNTSKTYPPLPRIARWLAKWYNLIFYSLRYFGKLSRHLYSSLHGTQHFWSLWANYNINRINCVKQRLLNDSIEFWSESAADSINSYYFMRISVAKCRKYNIFILYHLYLTYPIISYYHAWNIYRVNRAQKSIFISRGKVVSWDFYVEHLEAFELSHSCPQFSSQS